MVEGDKPQQNTEEQPNETPGRGQRRGKQGEPMTITIPPEAADVIRNLFQLFANHPMSRRNVRQRAQERQRRRQMHQERQRQRQAQRASKKNEQKKSSAEAADDELQQEIDNLKAIEEAPEPQTQAAEADGPARAMNPLDLLFNGLFPEGAQDAIPALDNENIPEPIRAMLQEWNFGNGTNANRNGNNDEVKLPKKQVEDIELTEEELEKQRIRQARINKVKNKNARNSKGNRVNKPKQRGNERQMNPHRQHKNHNNQRRSQKNQAWRQSNKKNHRTGPRQGGRGRQHGNNCQRGQNRRPMRAGPLVMRGGRNGQPWELEIDLTYNTKEVQKPEKESEEPKKEEEPEKKDEETDEGPGTEALLALQAWIEQQLKKKNKKKNN